ncbi:hypothetical protein Tco_1446476 [Tanacetum coccineum]
MYVIEQPLPAAPATNSEANVLLEWNAIYDAYNEVACLILGSMTPELHRQFENSSPYDMIKELKAMFEKQARVERFDLIQTFHACKQEEGKPVVAYILQMKGYVDQLERIGYMQPQDLIVGLILNGLTKDFARFVRNYNMHNMGRTIVGKIQKAKKKSLKSKGKEGGHWKRNCPVYLTELLKKKKQVGSASSLVVAMYAELFEKNLITQEVSGRVVDLEEIQDEDTSPSKITSKIPMEVEGFEPPQEEVILIRRSKRTHQAPDHLYLNVEVEEHSLGDLNEPTSYKAAMLDSESNK